MNLGLPIPMAVWAYVAVAAGLLAVGAYIIKMRRRRFEVPFSKLWQRVLDQRDANALWKQLRRLLSLLLILLVLGLILVAALDPTLGGSSRKARSVVVLLDASASMKATDGTDDADGTDAKDGGAARRGAAAGPADDAGTRMAQARRRAKELVASMGGGDVAMIIRVDGQATPLSRFSSDAPMLSKIIDGVRASDTPADLPRALGAAADALRDRKNPLVVLISDGAFPDAQLGLASFAPPAPAPPAAGAPPAQGAARWDDKDLATVDLSGIDVRYLPVGERSDNAGIVAFNVRRYVANKAAYEVFIELQNFGTDPAQRRLTLYNGVTAVEVRDVMLAPGQRHRELYRELPGGEDNRLRATLRPIDGGATDPFPLDDEAFALLPARKKQKVLLVTEDNLYLEGAIMVYDNIDPAKVTPAEFDANPALANDFAVVVFDEHAPAELPAPPTNLLFFHPPQERSPIRVTGAIARPRVTEVDEDHPVMRWVSMSDVNFDKSLVLAPDRERGEASLVRSVRDTIAAAKRDGGRKIVVFGFSLPAPGREDATDLPLRVAFPLLLVNALDYFAGDDVDLLSTYATGRRERVVVDGVPAGGEATITGPQGHQAKTPILDGQATFYAPRVGFYELAAGDAEPVVMPLAANLASPAESDIAPSTKLSLGGKELAAPEPFTISQSRKLWLFLLLFAAILIGLEWITYHRRVTV